MTEIPEKPPRMRWATYQRLQVRHAAHADRLGMRLMARLFRGRFSAR